MVVVVLLRLRLRLVAPLLLFKSAVVLSRPPHFLLLPVPKVAADLLEVVVDMSEVEEVVVVVVVDNVIQLARQHSSRTYSDRPPRTRTMATTIPPGDTMGSIIIPEMLTRVIFSMV